MNPKYQKIYTCTPVAFHGNEWFFIRDSGLISRTLRQLGAESRAVMPLPYYDDDLRDEVLRTEYRNLESAKWWASLGIDGCVLYSWGAPRYRRIARAIHKAGIRLVIHMDSSGNFVGAFPEGTSLLRRVFRRAVTKVHDFFRAEHLSYADVITMCPDAAAAVSRRLFYDESLVRKCVPMTCPIGDRFTYDGREKKNHVLCIARWDDTFQKRPEMLVQTLEAAYTKGCTADTYIYGTITDELKQWHKGLPAAVQKRIIPAGFIDNEALCEVYRDARIILCTSLYESSHIVSCEGLCCGCSIVTPNRPEDLRDVLWYTTRNSGSISEADTSESLAGALLHELSLWDTGKRNPQAIAAAWQPDFHASRVFDTIFN